MTSGSTVLIVSTDPVIGALLGLLAEVEQHRPVYDQGDESPQAALNRHRPRLVLLDVEHPDGFSPEFLARAEREGVKIVVFGHRDLPSEVRQQAEARDITWLALPTDRATFGRTLAEALRGTR
jgi:DNA-binding NtrC family response regulator